MLMVFTSVSCTGMTQWRFLLGGTSIGHARGFFASFHPSAGRNRARQTLRQRKNNLFQHPEQLPVTPLAWVGVSIHIQSVLNTFLLMSFTRQKLLIVFTGPNVRFHLKVFDYLRSTAPFGGLGTVFVASWVISLFPESILWVKGFAVWRIWCGLSPDSWFSHKVLRRSSSN